MKQEIHKDVTVTTRGQLTLPAIMRRAMRLGHKRKVRVTLSPAGEISIQPLPDVMSFFGALKGGRPYDPQEKSKARAAMGSQAPRRD